MLARMGLLVDGKWQNDWYTADAQGHFVRNRSAFRSFIRADGSTPFSPERGRYHLYVSHACPWAHRTLIVRALKGLGDAVSVSAVEPVWGPMGWRFGRGTEGEGLPDPLYGLEHLWQLYTKVEPNYTGRVTVPVLWDKQTHTIVNNESREIVRMLGTELDAHAASAITLAPESILDRIEKTIDTIYEPINNGVYRAGFAESQAAYDEAVDELFAALSHWEEVLDEQRFLCGDVMTEADIFLFATLFRFDSIYYGHFKCNLRQIRDYYNLWGFVRDVYQTPGVRETCFLEEAKRHYYASHERLNPSGIVPKGPVIDFLEPHDRGERFKGGSLFAPAPAPKTSVSAAPQKPALVMSAAPAKVEPPPLITESSAEIPKPAVIEPPPLVVSAPPVPALVSAAPAAAESPTGEKAESIAPELSSIEQDSPAKEENKSDAMVEDDDENDPPPRILSLEPAGGALSGGGEVMIRGEHFARGCQVFFGEAPAECAREGIGRLRVKVPGAARRGYVDVRVKNPDGKQETRYNGFLYEEGPVIASVDPSAASVLGGVKLTVLGANFPSGSAVLIGGIELETVRVDATHLEATTLPRPAGIADVIVRTPDGQEAKKSEALKFLEPPTLIEVIPAFGLSEGGEEVRLRGTHFAPGATVLFGEKPAENVRVVSAAEIYAVLPPHAQPERVDVTVINPGVLLHRMPRAFSYRWPPPRIDSVSPESGPSRGGTEVVIRGAYFDKGCSVVICGIEVKPNIKNSEELVFTTPEVLRSGPAELKVINKEGLMAVKAEAYCFQENLPAPALESLYPAKGKQTGGQKVALYGQDMREGCTVSFGGRAAPSVKFLTGKQIEVVTPPHEGSGFVPVMVSNPDGQSAILEDVYCYEEVPPPVIVGVRPNFGPTIGGTRVVIEGEHFSPLAQVYVGRELPRDIVVKSAEEIHIVTMPRAMVGMVDVEVRVPGLAKAVKKNAYRYDATPAPALSGVSPTRGGVSGGTELSISGSNFVKETVVLIDNRPVKSQKYIDKSTIEIKTAPGNHGAMVDVVVRNPDGKEAVLRRAFMYDSRYD